jgi:hypothetical protein
MKSRFFSRFVATSIMTAGMLLPMGAWAQTNTQSSTTTQTQPAQHVARRHTRAKRRTTKKSAMIVGGSGLGGAAIGALAGGKKGAVIGGLAGAGGGYVYDRKTQKKPVIPK